MAHDVMWSKHHTRTAREKEGAENPVLGRRLRAAVAAGGCRRVGKAIATNESPPNHRRPDFSSLDNVHIYVYIYTCSLNVYYARIYIYTYTHCSIYALSNPPTPPDGVAGTLLRHDPPPSVRANALSPRATKMEGDSR